MLLKNENTIEPFDCFEDFIKSLNKQDNEYI